MTRHRHDGPPPQGPEFAEFLRRELHAAADQLEPGPDGLERIRARVRSGSAYASKHSEVHQGFLAGLVRRWNTVRGGQDADGTGEREGRDWRYGWLRPALAAACAVFAIGVALAVPPLREAFVQLGTAVGISSSSTPSGAQGENGTGTPVSSAGRRPPRVPRPRPDARQVRRPARPRPRRRNPRHRAHPRRTR